MDYKLPTEKKIEETTLGDRKPLIKLFLKEMALDYHKELEQWSNVDRQPTNVGFDYLAQMLVSLVTGRPGSRSAARGVDIIIKEHSLPPKDERIKKLLADMRKIFQKAANAKTIDDREKMIFKCNNLCNKLFSASYYHKCEAKFTEAKLFLLQRKTDEWKYCFQESLQYAGDGPGEVKSVNEVHCTDVQRWHTGSKDLLSWHKLYLVRWDLSKDERFRVRIGIPNMKKFRGIAYDYFSSSNIELGQKTPWDLQLRPIGRHKCHCSKCKIGKWKEEANENASLALPRKYEKRLDLNLLLHAEENEEGKLTILTLNKDN